MPQQLVQRHKLGCAALLPPVCAVLSLPRTEDRAGLLCPRSRCASTPGLLGRHRLHVRLPGARLWGLGFPCYAVASCPEL